MCRHLAYLGPPVALRTLLFDAPHALVRQAHAPRFQYAGNDNPDGWGVAWGSDPVHRYRSADAMWDDTGFAGTEVAGSVLAAARYATTGSSRDVWNSAPFVADGWAFSLNGYVSGFRQDFGDELRSRLTPRRVEGIEGDTDSEVVFALILDQLDVGVPPGEALADVARLVRIESTGALNLLLTDGHGIYATAAAWVYVVALNAERSRFRRDRRIAGEVESDGRIDADQADATVARVVVEELLEGLPPRQRAAVVLRYLGDLTVPEIARALHCAEGTVKSALHDALRNLRLEAERSTT